MRNSSLSSKSSSCDDDMFIRLSAAAPCFFSRARLQRRRMLVHHKIQSQHHPHVVPPVPPHSLVDMSEFRVQGFAGWMVSLCIARHNSIAGILSWTLSLIYHTIVTLTHSSFHLSVHIRHRPRPRPILSCFVTILSPVFLAFFARISHSSSSVVGDRR